jgi:hypothetical protein
MHLRNLTDVRPHDFNSFICLLVVGIATCGTVIAQDHPTGGPTPSPPGAEAYFVDIKDGQHLPVKAVIHFGLRNMGVAPAGVDKPNTGHHHLLIDASPLDMDRPIPNDFNHLHFGAGQTEAKVELPLGWHRLQLVLGDENHMPFDPPVMSEQIKVLVTATDQRPVRHRSPRSSKR